MLFSWYFVYVYTDYLKISHSVRVILFSFNEDVLSTNWLKANAKSNVTLVVTSSRKKQPKRSRNFLTIIYQYSFKLILIFNFILFRASHRLQTSQYVAHIIIVVYQSSKLVCINRRFKFNLYQVIFCLLVLKSILLNVVFFTYLLNRKASCSIA